MTHCYRDTVDDLSENIYHTVRAALDRTHTLPQLTDNETSHAVRSAIAIAYRRLQHEGVVHQATIDRYCGRN